MTREMWMGLGGLAGVFLSVPTALIILALSGHAVGSVIFTVLLSIAAGAAGAHLVQVFWDWRNDRKGARL